MLELLHQPGPGFYSWFFLVQKATGRWWPVIDLSNLNGFITLNKFSMEMVSLAVGLEVNQERGCHVLDRPQGRIFSDSCPSGVLYVPSVCCSGEGVPVQGALFRPFCNFPGLYQCLVWCRSDYMYLRFVVQGKVYQFRALCFGLSITSQVFTSVWSGVGVNSSEGDLPALLSGW